MSQTKESGYAPVNGVDMYWESYGAGGSPVLVVHGGYGVIGAMTELIARLSQAGQVVAVELQGHGHTRDIDRPLRYKSLGDDLAALAEHLGLKEVQLLGYSLGAGVCLRAALQHPAGVRKLAIVSFPYRRDGWYPEVRAGFDQMSSALFARLQRSPMYAAYAQVAPDPDAFPALMDKTGDLQRNPYDWSEEVKGLRVPTLLVFADADGIPIGHVAEFYALLGGGLRDASWDGSQRAEAELAILPGRTHYDIFQSAELAATVARFFS